MYANSLPMANGMSIRQSGGVGEVRPTESVAEAAPVSSTASVGETGLGPVEYTPARRSGLGNGLRIGLLTVVTAVLMAAAPAAFAANPGAPVDTTGTEAVAEVTAPQHDAQWTRAQLSADQVVASRFWDGDQLRARIELKVPWPESAAQDIESASMKVFADGEKVNARVEDGVLHLDYVASQGLQATLQGKGVFELRDADGDMHLLTVEAQSFTADNTQLFRQETENHLEGLQERLEAAKKYDNKRTIRRAERDIRKAERKLKRFDRGKTYRSVVETARA